MCLYTLGKQDSLCVKLLRTHAWPAPTTHWAWSCTLCPPTGILWCRKLCFLQLRDGAHHSRMRAPPHLGCVTIVVSMVCTRFSTEQVHVGVIGFIFKSVSDFSGAWLFIFFYKRVHFLRCVNRAVSSGSWVPFPWRKTH